MTCHQWLFFCFILVKAGFTAAAGVGPVGCFGVVGSDPLDPEHPARQCW
jgi:hypothetical protein